MIEATPFKITSNINKEYNTATKLHITWGVDNKFFNSDSRVKILMSDDFGKTFKHVLNPSTPNNGQCDVFIPQQVIGKFPTYSYVDPDTGKKIDIWFSAKGVIKIETTQGETKFYDLTDQSANNGGIEIKAAPITFNLPVNDKYIQISKEQDIPEAPQVIAMVNGKEITTDFVETKDNNIITRTWKTIWQGETYGVQQFIEIVDNDNPNTPSGIKNISNADETKNIKLHIDKLKVNIYSLPIGMTATILSIDGKIIDTITGRGLPTTLKANNSGIYILKIADKKVKKIWLTN